MIVIVDTKTANLGSVVNIFKRIGVPVRVAEEPNELAGATHLLLPGVGHFDVCAKNLRTTGFRSALEDLVKRQHLPILGICVGAQLMTNGSEEGFEDGLGWIKGKASRFPELTIEGYKIPHMGWNLVRNKVEHKIFNDFTITPRFYFAHSYHIQTDDKKYTLATTTHGIEFSSAIINKNIIGVQFHPEKSHRFGMQLLKNFSNMPSSITA
jgi:glutamine amidotransferase